jgi:hypothetical protein
MRTLMLITVLASVLLSCTTKELYNSAQSHRKSKCNEEIGVMRENCIKDVNKKSYEDYEKARKEIIKPKH